MFMQKKIHIKANSLNFISAQDFAFTRDNVKVDTLFIVFYETGQRWRLQSFKVFVKISLIRGACSHPNEKS